MDNSDRKIRLLFVCHGNICRSPMAEYIFKHLAKTAGMEDCFEVASAAVSTEEIGNDIYPQAKMKLREHGIPYTHHAAHQLTREEYEYYDKVICADMDNVIYIPGIAHVDYDDFVDEIGMFTKTSTMMQWAGEERDVFDPWYTRDFESAYRDIYTACKAILEYYTDIIEF